MKLEFRKLKWWQWILAIGLLPVTLTLFIWQKKNWPQNKKLQFIAVIWLLFIVFGAYQELKPTPAPREVAQQHISEPSKPNEEKKQEEKPFTEDEALLKIKNYEFESTLKGARKTRTLVSYFAELESLGIASNGSWKINPAGGIENAYYVVYAYQAYGDYKNPKWLVKKDALQAVDEESKSITADLAPSGYSQEDELIYDSFNSNLGTLMDTKPSSTTTQLDAIYEEAYRQTAKEYKITVDEVKQAISRSQKANAVR